MPAELRKKSRKEAKKKKNEDSRDPDPPSTEYTPTGFRWGATLRHALMRMVIIGALIYILQAVYSRDMPSLARREDDIEIRVFNRNCSDDYTEDRRKFKVGQLDGEERLVHYNSLGERLLILLDESPVGNSSTNIKLTLVIEVAKAGLSYGGSTGGASILDLHTGALSQGTAFVNIYKLLEDRGITDVFSEEDIMVYKSVSTKIRMAISVQFRVPNTKLYLTSPTFFSKMTNKPAQTVHDEYWHEHVDKETYNTFDYTSLLYLSDYQEDFQGGRFVFVDSTDKKTIEPKFGRVSFFTSGSENTHYVEKVTDGTRYAMTISFTCDRSKAIQTPTMKTS